MHAAQISLVGRQPGGAIQGLRVSPSPEDVVLLHSDDPQSRLSARRARAVAEGFLSKGHVRLVRIDPFGMLDVIRQISTVATEHPDWTLSVNISGGTNIMASAALVACFMIGADAFYVKEAVGDAPAPFETRIIRLPVPRVTLQELDTRSRQVLSLCRRAAGPGMAEATSTVGAALGISPQLASYHLKRLSRLGLIDMTSDGRSKTASLTDSGRLFASMLRDPA